MATYMIGERARRNLTLESLRADLMYQLRNKTQGLYFFPSGGSLLPNRDLDQKLLVILCPSESFDAINKAVRHLEQLLLECNKWWKVLEQHGPRKYWGIVASSTSKSREIKMTPIVARELTLALLKGRQRWQLRQTRSGKDAKTLLIAALQRLLERFEAQNPSNPLLGERGWQLTDGEKKAARESLVPMGPTRQISNREFILSPRCPQKLEPISDMAGGPEIKPNLLGLVDEMVSKVTPAEAVQALLPSHSETTLITRSPSIDESHGLFSPSIEPKKPGTGWMKSSPGGYRSSGWSSPIGSDNQTPQKSSLPSTASKRRLEVDDSEHLRKKQALDTDIVSDESTGTTSQAPVTPVQTMRRRRPPPIPLRSMRR